MPDNRPLIERLRELCEHRSKSMQGEGLIEYRWKLESFDFPALLAEMERLTEQNARLDGLSAAQDKAIAALTEQREALKAQNAKLRELVRKAFSEGCNEGSSYEAMHHGPDAIWDESMSKQALEAL